MTTGKSVIRLATVVFLLVAVNAVSYADGRRSRKSGPKAFEANVTDTRHSYRPSAKGIDARRDSLQILKMREMLDSIRTVKHRPTVALVLSGGGAKGAAHIGVIRRLEELAIPVDVVLGTSMGGLVGGMFAVGYNSSQLDSIITSIDWGVALSDKVPRNYISYNESRYKEKFTLSFPFFYSKKDFMDKRAEEEEVDKADKKHDELHLGAKDMDSASELVRNNILGSLPSGYVFGQNVNNLISSLTVGHQDECDFASLPVPFLCVATDMVSAKAKLWYDGELNMALRSTMSIPGLFAPVKTGGMVLVDGGMRNNYPCDIAKEMGADIVIGVDLSSGYKKYSGINNVMDIISQGIDMLGRSSYEYNSDLAEVKVKPSLPEYDMLSFDAASIDTIINRGYAAALAKDSLLLEVKKLVGNDTQSLNGPRARNLNWEGVRISGIEITGVTDGESQFLMNKLDIDINAPVSHSEIEDAVATIYGTMAFDYVTYELDGKCEPYRLKINCKKGPIHQFGVGLRMDTEERVAAIFNLGLNVHAIKGSAFNVVGKIGSNPYVDLQYYHKSPLGPTLNVTGLFKRVDRNQFNSQDNSFTVNYLNLRNEVYLSNLDWKKFDLKLGLRNDYYKVFSVMAESVSDIYDGKADDLTNYYLSAFFSAREDTFDDGYFPTRGIRVGLDYSWTIGGVNMKVDNIHALQLSIEGAVPFGDKFTLLPSFNARVLAGEGASSPYRLPYMNLIGGDMRGRYMDQQIPFVGVNNAVPTSNWLALARLDLRYKLFRNNYVTAKVNVGDSFEDLNSVLDVNSSYGMLGFGLEYAYDSIAGPIKVMAHWSNLSHKLGLYISLGFDF